MAHRLHKLFKLWLVVICLFSLQADIPAQEASRPAARDALGALRYRYIGPVGNRVTCVVGIPGQPNIYYVGAASGGIWKTIDAGSHWEPVFDDHPVSSIGSQIEIIRSQLNNVTTLLGVGSSVRGGGSPARDGARSGASDFSAIKSAADALDKRLIEIEEELVQRKLTGQGQDTVRWPPKLISKLNYLGNGLAGSDFPPTTQHREVHTAFKAQLSALRSKLDDVINKDLDAFNKLLRDRGVGNVIPRMP